MSKNFGNGTVLTPPSPAISGTSLTLSTGQGGWFNLGLATIYPAATVPTPTTAEVVNITNIVGDVLTITRAQEGSSAQTVLAGFQVVQGVTAGMYDALSALASGAAAKANNLSDLTNAATARTNLGLGTAATQASTAFDAAGAAAAAQAASLQKASNLSDLANAVTARTNLGLGGAAILNVGKAASTVAAGDDERFYMPWRFYPEDYGAKGDGRTITDAAITSGTTALTSASAPFTSADTGKTMLLNGAGPGGAPLTVTLTYVSATAMTTSVAASTTVTAGVATYGTDDTAAINSAVSAAVTYANANRHYCEIKFRPVTYILAGATTKGAGNAGNAQIPLPLVAVAATKLVIAFVGSEDQGQIPHWQQTIPQMAGTVLLSTLTGQAVDGVYGLPSILAGPTPQQGYGTGGTFDNICPVIDGITFMAPRNPTIAALDFRGCGEAVIKTAAALVHEVPSNLLSLVPTSSWSTGVFMPALLNNAYSFIGSFACEGYYFGASLGPHTAGQRIFIAYCGYAVYVPATGSDKHGVTVARLEVEECNTAITTDNSAGPNTPINVDLDCEGINTYPSLGQGYHISDPAGALGGSVRINDSAGNQATFLVNGGANLEIIALNQPRGAVAAPAVPASTTAYRNPFWRNASVRVTGGTVSAIAVDGQATGVTSGLIDVPSGKSVTLTYTVAPTWTWMLF